METEKVKEVLLVRSNDLYPPLLDDRFLVDNNVIESSESIDRSYYQISNFGSHIQFNDGENTVMDISLPYLKYKSQSREKLINFYTILKEKTSFKVDEIGFNQVFHLSEPGIFKTLMDRIYSSQFEIEQIKFRSGNHSFTIYECRKDRIHISVEFEFYPNDSTELRNLELDLSSAMTKSNELLNQFLKHELDVNEVL